MFEASIPVCPGSRCALPGPTFAFLSSPAGALFSSSEKNFFRFFMPINSMTLLLSCCSKSVIQPVVSRHGSIMRCFPIASSNSSSSFASCCPDDAACTDDIHAQRLRAHRGAIRN